ncbi:MAG: hypothetical protein B6I35_04175 [Anaerolineaceae bacterium 4572_32.2]|nr:MAG: hypothetical protein B6I35_04175 [Anaerolineaceae bacterium 4572_32.2]HEY72661.1 response regulator transcription factor [Thermoflexia bacterium]
MSPVHTILLVEGRKSAAEYLAPDLDDKGYNIVTARTRRDSLAIAQEKHPAVIVLDAPSLRFSCHRFCKTLQDTEPDSPVLVLLPEGEKIDRSIGARAHLRYPFSTKKLLRRIARLLPASNENVLQVGDITLNTEQQYVIRDKRESHLTPKQTQLLEILMRHPGEVLSRAFLMKQVWKTDYLDDTRTLDVHIHCVRKAIEDNHKSPVYLQTVRKVGYCLTAPKKE